MAEAARAPWGWIVAGGLALFMLGRCSAETSSSMSQAQGFAAAPAPAPAASTAPQTFSRYVSTATLNCRASPSTGSRVVAHLIRNERVDASEPSQGWSRLEVRDCWVKTSLLSESPVAEPAYDPPAPQRFAAAPARVQRFASSGSAYYPNCSAARAAGAAPVYANEPGYSRRLDRDGDGVGCE